MLAQLAYLALQVCIRVETIDQPDRFELVGRELIIRRAAINGVVLYPKVEGEKCGKVLVGDTLTIYVRLPDDIGEWIQPK